MFESTPARADSKNSSSRLEGEVEPTRRKSRVDSNSSRLEDEFESTRGRGPRLKTLLYQIHSSQSLISSRLFREWSPLSFVRTFQIVEISKSMAPKTRSAVAKRPRVAFSEREGRSKQRFDGSSSRPAAPRPTAASSSSSSSSGAPRAPPPSLEDRVITTGRKIDFSFLDEQSFQIGNWIKSQGWEFFCSLNLLTYPSLVREFYRNLKRGSGSIESTVKGISIVLTESRLGRIWEMPRTGSSPFHAENRLEALQSVVNIPVLNDIGDCYASMLSVEMRLLHHIITRIFIPKTGRFDFVSERELVLMHFMLQGRPLNMPAIMLHQIREAPKRAKACLPYGMALTLVFQEFHVPLEGEDKKKLSHFDTYNKKSLVRMGYKYIDGQWIRKESGQEEARSVEPQPAPPPAPASPASEEHTSIPSPAPAPAPATTGMSDDEIMRVAALVGEYLRTHPPEPQIDRAWIEGEFASIRAEVARIAEQMDIMRSSRWDAADFHDMAKEAALLRGRIDRAESTITSEFQAHSVTQREGITSLMESVRGLVRQLERIAPIAASASTSYRAPHL